MPQYMSISDIKGSVTTKNFIGAIAIDHVSQQGIRSVIQHIGTSTQEASLPALTHIQITKSTDDASALLWQYFYTGKTIPHIEISNCTLSSNGAAEWQSKLLLDNVMISQMQEDAHDMGGKELLTLSFNKIERSYRSQNKSGQWQTSKRTSFDLQTAEAG